MLRWRGRWKKRCVVEAAGVALTAGIDGTQVSDITIRLIRQNG